MNLIATICNVETIASFTTSSRDITKPYSTAKVSEVPTYSEKETLEKSPFIGSYLLINDDVTKAEIRWCLRNEKVAYLCIISRRTRGLKLIFCLQINIKVFYKLILSLWVCVARHVQRTQNNKFAISL